jgi:integrase
MSKIHFNQKKLDSLKPTAGKPQVDYWDESFPYFGLRVSSTGRKTWTVMYLYRGRLKRMTLGQYGSTGLGLADARQKARDIHQDAAKGLDPASIKKEDRLAESYDDLVARYLEWAEKSKSSWKEDKRILSRDVLPHWKNHRAKEITRKDVIKLVDAIVKRGARVHANRTFSLVRRVFNFGIEKDIVQFNPCIALKPPTKEQARERVLSAGEIRKVWSVLEGEDFLMSAILKLQFFTAQRPGEVRAMEWSEIDLESNIWTIPGDKTKNGLAHRVPLSGPAVALLKELAELYKKSRWVFPSSRGTGTYIGSVQKLIERIRNHDDENKRVDFTAHDIRRTAASHMAGIGIPRLVISKILNHVETGITRVYDRHGYDNEKREAMDAWACQVEVILQGADRSSPIPIEQHRTFEKSKKRKT